MAIKIVNSDKKEIKKKPKDVNTAIVIGEYGNVFLTATCYAALVEMGFESNEITSIPITKSDSFMDIAYMLQDIIDEHYGERFVFIFTNSAFRVAIGKKLEKALEKLGEIVFYIQE